MNKAELIDTVATQADLSKSDAANAVDAVFSNITKSLAGGNAVTLGNPRTGEAITIPASKNPKFKAGKALKDALN